MKRVKVNPTIKRKFNEQKNRVSLMLVFALTVFGIIFCALGAAMGLTYLLVYLGVIGDAGEYMKLDMILKFVSVFSLVLGTVAAFFSSRLPLRSVNTLINKMNRLAAGDFKVRLEFNGPLKTHPAAMEISESFNKMAEELEGTEMLRADFINNFSHEFKTPIVAISGLAKLVNKGNISEEQRRKYLLAIEEESFRLATMATNVLNLTKVENQTILTDTKEINISEQIRSSILLLENKWTSKNIELNINFDEYILVANEELLKQVWINLVDNAIKFSPRNGALDVRVAEKEDSITVQFTNEGDEITPENKKKIFNKFYQADESHASEGNGIGLAIVKRIVELHGGNVDVICENGRITFEVVLPK